MNKEAHIKATAKDIFFLKGNLHATTQEIADEAGVNRSLINYYFKSRDLLFKIVYNEAVETMRSQLDNVIYSEKPFMEKLESLIEVYMDAIIKYPYKESFLITEICSKNFLLKEKKKSQALIAFVEEIKQEMEKGTIKKTDPVHFIINLFSLMAYPVIMAPIYRKLFDLNKERYKDLMSERKALVFKLITE
nr:TetR/AcrR family transcriptional regulator [uncultured Pedobacter sp.]